MGFDIPHPICRDIFAESLRAFLLRRQAIAIMPASGNRGCPSHDTLATVGSKMNPTAINAVLASPFVSVALPIVFAVFLASWMQNKRFDDMNRRFDDMNRRFDDGNRRFEEILARLIRIEAKLDNHEERLIRVEERTSPVGKIR